jgi:hypothetical protein
MKALTPVRRHHSRQVSSLISHTRPDVPSPTTEVARISLYTPSQRIRCVSGFAVSQGARRHVPPNRVRHPTDRQFASGCSPPRLLATQLPSATGIWLTPTRTFTVLCARLHERTRSPLCGRMPATPQDSPGGRAPTAMPRHNLCPCRCPLSERMLPGAGFYISAILPGLPQGAFYMPSSSNSGSISRCTRLSPPWAERPRR